MGAPYALSSDLVSAWPAKSLEVAQYIDGQLPLIAMTQNAQTGTTYSLAATDFTKLVTLSNASPVTVTVPLESSVAWVAGTQLRLMNLGAGVVTVVGAGGVTINGTPLTLAQYKDGTLTKTGTNTWTFTSSGVGKILQVVSANYSTPVTNSTGAYIDSGLSATITPSSTANKILVFANQTGLTSSGTSIALNLRIVRGATEISVFGVAATINTTSLMNYGMNYLDSPATVSATTYKTQFVRYAASGSATIQANSDMSGLTLMEVSA